MELYGQGKSIREIAEEIGVPKSTVANWLSVRKWTLPEIGQVQEREKEPAKSKKKRKSTAKQRRPKQR